MSKLIEKTKKTDSHARKMCHANNMAIIFKPVLPN